MKQLRHVVLVEDDPDIAALAQIALRDFGQLECTHFSSGEEALERLPAIAPDLIVLDFRLPGMNGQQVLEKIRSDGANPQPPVVFMTASLMPNHVEKLIAAGALAVLPKPFDPLALPDRLKEIWESTQCMPSRVQ
ncbi:response regulator [Sphingomonas lutea]|uniref:Response regulator n=1 Tax=Sphingomonas lutea TaxID=1045317 RepID=A0A7G9SG98_9SPHN|nr:response regulator [Sphingomonas lutea]QNN66873.1 response regulator [Sphingomonas lutea]